MTSWLRSAILRAGIFSLVAAAFCISNYGYVLSNPQSVSFKFFLEPFIYWNLCGLITPMLFWVIKRYPPSTKNLGSSLARYGGAVIVASLAHEVVMFPIQVAFFPLYTKNVGWLVVWLAVKGMYFFSAIMLAVFAVEYYRSVNESRLRRSSLEASLSRAQYEVLNNQIRPHFLFNTLNAMAALSRDKPAATRRMALLLSDLLERASAKRSDQTVELREEIELLDRYVNIMRIRFSESLTISVSVPSELYDLQVPQFLLQPLVENAIKYAADEDGKMEVSVSARRDNGALAIRVADRGPSGLDTQSALGSGTGMANLRRRLTHLYGDAASCDIRKRSDDRGVEVLVFLPCESRDYAASA